MDRGRQIDNIQNINARYFDQFGTCGKTSTKITHPPGGEDHFSLGWEYEEPKPKYTYGRKRFDQPTPNAFNYENKNNNIFGNYYSNYGHYRK